MFNSGWITFQSLSSIKTVLALGVAGKANVLDLCSAPGGKSVLIGELAPECNIVACDLHKHRVELIDKYAKRMGVDNISTVVNDATKLKKEWVEKFDYVLVDAPCSCFGTYKKHPDVFLNRNYDQCIELSKIQKSILENAIKYTKSGGTIVYSTCTLFDVENIDVVRSVLDKAELVNIDCDGLPKDKSYVRLLPDDGSDGFFIAKLRKI
jgi:16S rRNA (cytosine967-C5)-methyltransferase